LSAPLCSGLRARLRVRRGAYRQKRPHNHRDSYAIHDRIDLLKLRTEVGPHYPLRGVRKAHRSEEHTSELQSLAYLVCRLLLEKKKIVRQPKRFSSQSNWLYAEPLTGSYRH